MALATVLTRVAVTAFWAVRLTGNIPQPGTTQLPECTTATHTSTVTPTDGF